MMITGINHITFAVRDLEQAFRFYQDLLGLTPIARWYEGAYFLAGSHWIALILDDVVRQAPLAEYSHIAFSVAQENFQPMVERLCSAGVLVWQENQSEGDSFYFLDPDGHKLEIHCGSVETRLEFLCRLSDQEKQLKGLQLFL